MGEIPNAKIRKEVVNKSHISEFINNSGLEKKTVMLATKVELKQIKSYFHGKSHFEDVGTQIYLVFQEILKYLQKKISIEIIFQHGNQKSRLMKALNFLLHLILFLLPR